MDSQATRVCKKCGVDKNIDDFRHQKQRNNTIFISIVCKKCRQEEHKPAHKKFRDANRPKLRAANKKYYAANKVEIKVRQKDKKKVWDHNYYNKNKSKIRKSQKRRRQERYENDSNFRVRQTVSRAISRSLKTNGKTKGGKSSIKALPYTIPELNAYLESKFEPWMSWNNYGTYNAKTWNDNDSTTWTWNIDHIKPHSEFDYEINYDDEQLKKCWSFDNLRPYSAKQNWLDGINKTRHNKKKAK